MKTVTKPMRVSGVLEEDNKLLLDEPLPLEVKSRVGILVRSEEDDDINEEDRKRWLALNSAYHFLKDPEEEIYSREDGKPFDAKR